MPIFKEVTLESWKEIHRHAQRGWIYRGEGNACDDLTTSLERRFNDRALPRAQRYDFEQRLFREFRRGYHQYAHRLPDRRHSLEWFSIMQHHGAPTRLLDFTYSIYVAAYFAFERISDGTAAIWSLDARWAGSAARAALAKCDKTRKPLPLLAQEEEEPQISAAIFDKPQVAMAWPLNPFYLNERLRLQKGTFLVPGDISLPLMDNLSALPGADTKSFLVKIRLPHSLRREGLRELFHMNISRTSLFPGLDGYAQSLGVYHPTIEEPLDWRVPHDEHSNE